MCIRDSLSSINTIMESAPDYEFRTTCVRGFVDRCIIERIAETIKGADLYALQTFHKSDMLNPEFFQDSSPGYDEEDMMGFKHVAEPFVKECVIR